MPDRRSVCSIVVLVVVCSFGAIVDTEAGENGGRGWRAGDWDPGSHRRRPRARPVILSTDIAIGLIDTHGGKSLNPVVFSATHPYTFDTDVTPQDIDDGLALAMASNLDAKGMVDLIGVIPTYGNASLPAEMLVARQIVRRLKRRYDIPIVPGATSPASPTLHPIPTWFDGSDVPVLGRAGSFGAACRNLGVRKMVKLVAASREPVTILAIGPLTDVACLLNTAPKRVLGNIKEVIALASRLEGQRVQINGLAVNDFNPRMDPIGAALLLGAKHAQQVKIRLMSFSLTGQTSQANDLIPFNAEVYPGPPIVTPVAQASFQWLLDAAAPRNAYWSGIFGTEEGPFDQYALVAMIRPDLFDCREARAYILQCPFPAWSPDFPSVDGTPTESPYNAPNNPCDDHGPVNGSALSQVPAQLLVTLDLEDDGPLVRGTPGIDGNVPPIEMPARGVTACIDFADTEGRQEFQDILERFTW
ncbi:MAG: nucleoside hydrolase [Thiohalocapsa sp.]